MKKIITFSIIAIFTIIIWGYVAITLTRLETAIDSFEEAIEYKQKYVTNKDDTPESYFADTNSLTIWYKDCVFYAKEELPKLRLRGVNFDQNMNFVNILLDGIKITIEEND